MAAPLTPSSPTEPDPFSRKPQDNVFSQQRLNTFSPVPSPNSIIFTLGLFAMFFLILGGVITASNENAYSVSVQYANSCPLKTNCTVNLTIDQDMKGPVQVYYILSDYYQNYRRYVKSHVDSQLRGEDIYSSLSGCDPLDKYNGHYLYPCGLVASSTFNDTFSDPILYSQNGTMSLKGSDIWNEDNIAWPLDKSKKFKNPLKGQVVNPQSTIGPNGKLPNVTDEHFIVWMRVAALPTFRKLYARLHHDFKKGDVVALTIANNYPVNDKFIALTTVSKLGVKNPFIEAMYYTVGTFCAIMGLLFFLKHKCISSRELGIVKYYQFQLPRVGRGGNHDVELKQMEKKQDSGAISPTPISTSSSDIH